VCQHTTTLHCNHTTHMTLIAVTVCCSVFAACCSVLQHLTRPKVLNNSHTSAITRSHESLQSLSCVAVIVSCVAVIVSTHYTTGVTTTSTNVKCCSVLQCVVVLVSTHCNTVSSHCNTVWTHYNTTSVKVKCCSVLQCLCQHTATQCQLTATLHMSTHYNI